MASALNNSANPVKAAQTMMAKETFDQRLRAWLKKQIPVPPEENTYLEGDVSVEPPEDEAPPKSNKAAFDLED
jgi:hypothetical protein